MSEELAKMLGCPLCPVLMEVSEEDPDATVSEMYGHLRWDHVNPHGVALKLLAQVGTS